MKAQVKEFWTKNQKVLTIVLAAVLAVLFIGSILLAVFIGGEFTQEEEAPVTTKGKLSFVSADYKTVYEDGEEFDFGTTEVQVIAKIPEETEIFRDTLYADEYGFMVNGEGEVYLDASEIIMTKDVTTISVVWVEYPNIKSDISVKVGTGADETGD